MKKRDEMFLVVILLILGIFSICTRPKRAVTAITSRVKRVVQKYRNRVNELN